LALASAADDLAQTTLLLYASRTEFLEVATYNGLVQMARGLGLGDVSDLLQMSLEEENAMRQQVDAALYERAQQLDELMGMPGMSENNATLHGYS
jgi:ferritin-like metal-binding protein YciE